MIEGLNGAASWATIALPGASAAPTGPMPAAGGWGALGLGQAQAGGGAAAGVNGLPAGNAWARSWADLSSRMRSVGVELDALGRNLSVEATSPADITANLNQMLKASRHLSEVSIQFQLASGLVTNAATGVNKLLTQQ